MRNSKRSLRLSKYENLSVSFDDMGDQDKEINSLLEDVKKKIKLNVRIEKIPFYSDNYIFPLIIYSIKKDKKNKNDLLFISHYLTTFPLISNLISSKKNYVDSLDILASLSEDLKLETYKANDIIFRFGDIGDKLYFIVKGSVSVIVKKERQTQMTLYEYVKYLEYLLWIKEKELYDSIVQLNRMTFTNMEISLYLSKKNDIESENPNPNQKIMYNPPPSNLTNINVDQYVNIVSPKYIENPAQEKKGKTIEKKEVNILGYYHVCNLSSGQTFGDIGLGENLKRSATIICNEETIFGVVSKGIFEKYLREYHEKIRKNRISAILSTDLFQDIKFETFNNNYFNLFKYFQLKQGEFLFEQGQKRKDIFFLKSGEIEINIKSSFPEISELLKKKKINVDDKTIFKWCKNNLFFANYYVNSIHLLKIFKNNAKSFVGLDDLVDENNIYMFNVLCKSSQCDLYSIGLDIFNIILEKEKKVKQKLPKLVSTKIGLIANRLNQLKNLILSQQYNYFTSKITITEDHHEEKKPKTSRVLNSDKNMIKIKLIRRNQIKNKKLLPHEIHKDNSKEKLFDLSRITKDNSMTNLNLSGLEINQESDRLIKLKSYKKKKSEIHLSSISERSKYMEKRVNYPKKFEQGNNDKLNGLNISFSEEYPETTTKNKKYTTSLLNSQNSSIMNNRSSDVSFSRESSTKRVIIPNVEENTGSKRKMKEITKKSLFSSSSVSSIDTHRELMYNHAMRKYMKNASTNIDKGKENRERNSVILSTFDILEMDKKLEQIEPVNEIKQYHPKNVISKLRAYTNMIRKMKELKYLPQKNKSYQMKNNAEKLFDFNISKYPITRVDKG